VFAAARTWFEDIGTPAQAEVTTASAAAMLEIPTIVYWINASVLCSQAARPKRCTTQEQFERTAPSRLTVPMIEALSAA
jgi:hypothetical protein